MKITNTVLAISVMTVSFAAAQPCHADALGELSPEQQASVLNGEQVFFTQDVDGAPWPRMYIYQKLNCAPQEAEALTMDYELRPSYTGELKSAHNEHPVNGPTMVTDYVMGVPVIGDEHFALSQTVSAYENGQAYRLDFRLVRADRAKATEGYTRFEPLQGGGTLMAVVSFIDPGVWGASLVTGQAEDRAQNAANGFGQKIEEERNSDRARLQQQIQVLKKALGQR